MPKLPTLSGKQLIALLETHGYVILRTRGSHVRLAPPASVGLKFVTVPLHDEIKPGLLRAIMRDAGLTHTDFN